MWQVPAAARVLAAQLRRVLSLTALEMALMRDSTSCCAVVPLLLLFWDTVHSAEGPSRALSFLPPPPPRRIH